MGGCCCCFLPRKHSGRNNPVQEGTFSSEIYHPQPHGQRRILLSPFQAGDTSSHTSSAKNIARDEVKSRAIFFADGQSQQSQQSDGSLCTAFEDLTGSRKRRALEQENIKLQEEIAARMKTTETLKRKADEMEKAMRILNLENEELKTRLSRLASNRLTDNNPNITDLNDPNRPLILSERFSELYCNEWSDAFEALTEGNARTLTEAISILLNIVADLYTESSKKAKEDMAKLTNCVTEICGTAEVPDELKTGMKTLKELRRRNVKIVEGPELKKIMSSIVGRWIQGSLDDKLSAYVKEAAEICWLMCIQDPPIFMVTRITEGHTFDKQLFSEFTARGEEYHYMVWPALLLEKDGQLLSKGVAQPKTKNDSADASNGKFDISSRSKLSHASDEYSKANNSKNTSQRSDQVVANGSTHSRITNNSILNNSLAMNSSVKKVLSETGKKASFVSFDLSQHSKSDSVSVGNTSTRSEQKIKVTMNTSFADSQRSSIDVGSSSGDITHSQEAVVTKL